MPYVLAFDGVGSRLAAAVPLRTHRPDRLASYLPGLPVGFVHARPYATRAPHMEGAAVSSQRVGTMRCLTAVRLPARSSVDALQFATPMQRTDVSTSLPLASCPRSIEV